MHEVTVGLVVLLLKQVDNMDPWLLLKLYPVRCMVYQNRISIIIGNGTYYCGKPLAKLI